MANDPNHCAWLPVIIGGIITIIGWPLSTFFAYRWGLKSQRVAREFAAKDAIAVRRREFLGFVCDIKTHIAECGDPAIWVNMFGENAPRLKAEFIKISHELSGDDKIKIQAAIDGVMKFAAMQPADIYANGQELLDAFNKFPDA